MLRKIAIDSGKAATKTAILRADGNVSHFKFDTKLNETTMEKVTDNKTSHIIHYKGKTYLIGNEAEENSYETSKTQMLHKLAIFTSLGSTIDNGDEVILGIGCPISTYKDEYARDNFKTFMLSDGNQITINIDGSDKFFSIKKLFVFPESAGLVYSNMEKYKKRLVGVIDIGGLNANCAVYKKGAPIASTMFTENLGANVFQADLKLKLETALGITLRDYNVEQALEDGFLKVDKERSSKIISEFKKEFVQKIVNTCKKNQWALEALDLKFIGGTSLLLKNEIKLLFPGVDDTCFEEDADFVNVDGFLEVLKSI